MKVAFRIECPKCKWGHPFSNEYINQGFVKGKCNHCGNVFFFKISMTGFSVEVSQEYPNLPVKSLDEVKYVV
jgi:transposase-like protein